MKANMGSTDRIIRIIFAIIVAVLYWQDSIGGVLAYVLLAVAAIFVITSFVGFCPLYTLFGFSSCKIKEE
ncbi:Protein of unknown function [Zobellia uliginosa]|uniref:Inner membrane protein YgaP-like transmembrane domain-containing protein n=1 Tax=Zobellia uliginosa TaxID=143224 RepID=A0ABY1L4M3_9FLAO|nr:DUF2892 domain-containing protein [Zobellia uliginosa]MDO6519407.1 DUF2892 domain-containing protein [Zobellia uliginosa]SIT03470.1 Protein of unknown function [Zobellia uliginosa]